MFKRIIFIVVVLCSLKFYELSFIPDIVIKLSEWIALAITLPIIVIVIIYGREKLPKLHFALPITFITIGVLLSMIGAYAFQNQSFAVTAYSQRIIYLYLFYFLLHFLKLPCEFIIKTMLGFALFYIGLYIS